MTIKRETRIDGHFEIGLNDNHFVVVNTVYENRPEKNHWNTFTPEQARKLARCLNQWADKADKLGGARLS